MTDKPLEGELIKVGRPRKFDKEMIETMLNVMENGGKTVQVCHKLQISRDTFYRWLREEPEFKEAYDFGKIACETWWENLGKMGLVGPQAKMFNTPLYLAFMGRNFKEKWKPAVKPESSGDTNIYIGSVNVSEIKNLSCEDLDKELKKRLSKLEAEKKLDKE